MVASPTGELPVLRLDYNDDGEGRPCGILLKGDGGRFNWQPMRVGGPYLGNGVPIGIRPAAWERVVVSRFGRAVRVERVGEEGKLIETLPNPFLQGAPSLGIGVRLSGKGDSVQVRSIAVQPR